MSENQAHFSVFAAFTSDYIYATKPKIPTRTTTKIVSGSIVSSVMMTIVVLRYAIPASIASRRYAYWAMDDVVDNS